MKRDIFEEIKEEFTSFKNGKYIIEGRGLWCEILIKEVHCDKCGNEERITLHSKDINKLIKILKSVKRKVDEKFK